MLDRQKGIVYSLISENDANEFDKMKAKKKPPEGGLVVQNGLLDRHRQHGLYFLEYGNIAD